jgi:hypothetical protein
MRYDIIGENWPPFDDRMLWYQTKLLAKTDNPYEEMSYVNHKNLCNAAFIKAGTKHLKGTHTGRREGCKLADMMDVPDAQMRRLGRWDHSRMVQHYSSGLPRAGARRIAGHGFEEGMTDHCIFGTFSLTLVMIRKVLSPS